MSLTHLDGRIDPSVAVWQKSFVPCHICHWWQQYHGGKITAMVVLSGIALILLLLLVVEPRGYPAQRRGWTGFVAGPSPRSTDRDDDRTSGDLRIF